ncbi:MAG: chemotaxis-specific protein-glutamate methyltransferase CheB [Nannocystis sp.]|nr:chemotaxis-specific protein-glutamate methyltransferase CheB [Nannocystis sp.]
MSSDPHSGGERERGGRLRALVVDDSAYNRQTLASMLAGDPGIEVVGRAVNGKEALQMAFELRPDVITLDLEMPDMDGFAFLRVLMAKRPTPVIVISSHSDRDHVFRALELGAIDFIAKPSRQIGPELRRIEEEVREKVGLVRRLEAVRMQERARSLAGQEAAAPIGPAPAEEADQRPFGVVAIAASTGGPPAIQQLLCALPATLPLAIVVAQHMPPRFTRAFAGRLDKICLFRVSEATDGEPLRRGAVYIAPGSFNVEIERDGAGARLRVRAPAERAGAPMLTPSGDLLFMSGAKALGSRFCALVLTGMGTDGREGAEAARSAGSLVLAEDPRTAVMPGMPGAAIEAGAVDQVLRLEELPIAIARFAEACRAQVVKA